MTVKNSYSDPFAQAGAEIEVLVQQVIKNSLLPLQTKKISKKLVEQIAADCGNQVAAQVIIASRQAAQQHASRLTKDISEILSTEKVRFTPPLNDKLISSAAQLAAESAEEIKASQELAAEVVSRIYRSIFDFAFERGTRTSRPVTPPSAKGES